MPAQDRSRCPGSNWSWSRTLPRAQTGSRKNQAGWCRLPLSSGRSGHGSRRVGRRLQRVESVQAQGAAGRLQPERSARQADSTVPRTWFRRRTAGEERSKRVRIAVATKQETMPLPQSRRPYHAPHLRSPRVASASLRNAEGRSRLLQYSPGRRFAAPCELVAMERPERAQSMREWSPAAQSGTIRTPAPRTRQSGARPPREYTKSSGRRRPPPQSRVLSCS